MGNEVASPSEPLTDVPHLATLQFCDVPDALAAQYGLPPSAELEQLLHHLFSLSCRDQEEDAFDQNRMKERRRDGYALAKSIRKEAQVMLQSLSRLHRDYQEFEQQVQFNPALLEAIFDVDTAGPENLFLPPELQVLQTLFASEMDSLVRELIGNDPELTAEDDPSLAAACPPGFWEAVDERLQAVADLPLKSRLPSGPVPNAVVRSALRACKSYWIAANQPWSMSSLKVKSVRKEDKVPTLKGRCERFVADALTVSGIRFNLSELHSSWEHVDAEARRQSPSS